MGRRSGGAKTLIPVVGHPFKVLTSEKWARQAERRGLGKVIDHVLYCNVDSDPPFPPQDRELREVTRLAFQPRGQACDIAHEHANDAAMIPGGPQFRTLQYEATDKDWAETLRKTHTTRA